MSFRIYSYYVRRVGKCNTWKDVSSIFKRKDNMYDNAIDELNQHIAKLSDDSRWLTFVEHSNINSSMMYNAKYLNKTGFHVMLTNLKYVMFKILPNF